MPAGQLAELLQPYSSYQRIHFQNPQFAFSHFEHPKEQEQFQDLTSRCVCWSSWACPGATLLASPAAELNDAPGLPCRLAVDWCCRRDEERAPDQGQGHLMKLRPYSKRTFGPLCFTMFDKKNVTYWC